MAMLFSTNFETMLVLQLCHLSAAQSVAAISSLSTILWMMSCISMVSQQLCINGDVFYIMLIIVQNVKELHIAVVKAMVK